MHARIPVLAQTAQPLLPIQQPVDAAGRDRLQLGRHRIAANQFLSSAQPRDFRAQRRRQTLSTRVIEQFPDLGQCRLHLSGVGSLAGPSFLLLADRGGMRQFADQHLSIQPRALPGFIQQPRLVPFICVPILLPNAFQILLP